MSVKEEIHSEIVGGLADATFPINTPEDLLAAMPAGPDAACQTEDVRKLIKAEDFPIESAKQIADILVERAGL
ncbi:hypothetical protein LI82_07630 [Methanococcoides methylutens]|uniref:MTH865-like family protein n=1 Tax=Methanococcoides methylutens TaxID=2226 RepID=A0A099T3D8_METMT|nr:MTH865 family protein [Methanococcoides methylutens]KGK98708.1 hypothetical protein LI82_07630 [Methanococcoides methylutens]